MKDRCLYLIIVVLLLFSKVPATGQIWLEAEAFDDKGGWIIDSQFMDQVGSSYLLAHGLGEPVQSARTTVQIKDYGHYHVWVRTKDWAPFPVGPGTFKIAIDNDTLSTVLGQDGNALWHWEYAGSLKIKQPQIVVSIHDLSGFEGRIDAIFLTKRNVSPPTEKEALARFRHQMLQLPLQPKDVGAFDMVVAGGGVAGICAAIQAARLGLKVALIQDRPMLGGNNSSEVRLPMNGDIYHNLYPKLGRIVRELDTGNKAEIASAEQYGDKRKLDIVNNEKNITLFLSTHVYAVEKKENQITAVLAKNVETGEESRFTSSLFADCTGDGTLGVIAGANYRSGRESFATTQEPKAPQIADSLTMGTTNHWFAAYEDALSSFPVCPWAVQFTDQYHLESASSAWFWESGFYQDKVEQAEEVRDYNFRVIYGHWAYLKNQRKKQYAKWKLSWVSYIAGKRESRRLMGDIILSEVDINNHVVYPDACITTTWGIDLHYPDPKNSAYYPKAEFLGVADHNRNFIPYHIPYRCLYSNNPLAELK